MFVKMKEKLAPRQLMALEKIVKILKKGPIAALTSTLIILELLGAAFFDIAQTPIGQQLDLTDYELVLSDEFDGDTLDLTKWHHRADGARRCGFNSSEMTSVKDGNLVIRAEYLEDGKHGPGWYADMIRTNDEFIRGYFEIRCICSIGGGFWSAFWLNSPGMASAELSNGGIGGAEIDIFEAFNYKGNCLERDSISTNVHIGGYGDGLHSMLLGSYKGKNIYTEYNTYGLEWTEDEYIFYINGVESVRTSFESGVSQANEYVIISLEIPDEVTEAKGFSTEFIVDYVKIWQKNAVS